MNKKNLRQEKGITLIALIITIIVMLILVAVTITVAVNGGLFNYAKKASDNTIEARDAEQELASLQDGLSSDDLIAKYTGGWYQKTDGSITNGKYTVALGDYINYECWNDEIDTDDLTYPSEATTSGWTSRQEFTLTESNSSSIKWRVIGAENGSLLITMENPIYLNNEGYRLKGAEGYRNGISELNKICAIYGHGANATGARSIKVEDINKITGYNPEKDTFQDENKGKPYGYGEAWQYGNKVKYFINAENNDKVSYESTVKSGDTNQTVFRNLGEEGNITEPLTVQSTYYGYDIGYNDSFNDTIKELICGEYDENDEWYPTYYWLASSCVNASEGNVYWGLRYVSDGGVDNNGLWNSDGGAFNPRNGVRPVVSLKSDIKLKTGTTANTWDFDTTVE